jgi:virulence-associated protein VapD
MFDRYAIMSSKLTFCHMPNGKDWLLEDSSDIVPGTFIEMMISTASHRTVQEVFDTYTSESDDYGFTRTHISVFLARYGDENLVSRSQAKRLLARIERFKEVILDFKGVSEIGQAFADEIFRVYKNTHPDVGLRWASASSDVEKMIKRALKHEGRVAQ